MSGEIEEQSINSRLIWQRIKRGKRENQRERIEGKVSSGKYLRNLFDLFKEYYQHARWNHHAITRSDSEHDQPLFPVQVYSQFLKHVKYKMFPLDLARYQDKQASD